MKSAFIEQLFPRLRGTGYRITSPEDPSYNCIAWAAGEDERWWWPASGYYWPPSVDTRLTLEAFVAAFSDLGFRLSDSPDPIAGIEKVAIFVDAHGAPTHAARQLPSGRWTSKLGQLEDIEHDGAADVGGSDYGEIGAVLERNVD